MCTWVVPTTYYRYGLKNLRTGLVVLLSSPPRAFHPPPPPPSSSTCGVTRSHNHVCSSSRYIPGIPSGTHVARLDKEEGGGGGGRGIMWAERGHPLTYFHPLPKLCEEEEEEGKRKVASSSSFLAFLSSYRPTFKKVQGKKRGRRWSE